MLQIKNTFNTELKKLAKYFKDLDKATISKAVNIAISKVALEFKRDVLPFTPRDKGELLNSWEVKKNNLSIEEGYTEVYAMYQEMGMRQDGTHVIRNRPAGGKTYFMKETLDENRNKYLKMYEETVFNLLFK